METYQEILDRIFTAYPMDHKVGSAAYKEGLENIVELLEIIGNPQRNLRCVHVAGTNGKGSVSSFLSSYFQELGYKTGLFTSPHLVDFRERIRINGTMIPVEEVLAWLDTLPVRPRVVGTSAHATKRIDQIDLTGPTLLLIGNETFGLSKAWKAACDELALIPIYGAASSLNAGCAASICLYEAARQRGD